MNIKEVAAKAGVSIATVSRVLNSPEKVSGATREKVLETIEELNYTPNWFARNIQNSRTNIIGVLAPDTLDMSNMEIAKGVEKIARKFNCNIILCNTGYEPDTERFQIETLVNRKVDGLILIDSLMDMPGLNSLKARGVPYVFVGRNDVSDNENLIYTDYVEAVEKVVDYLCDMERSRIVLLLPDDNTNTGREKAKGYRKALQRNGIEYDDSLLVYCDNSIAGGHVATEQLLDSVKPDAVFAGTDTIAFGAIEAVKGRGLSPDDVSVIGYEGLEAGAVVEPKLTTVIKPSMRMGLMAGRLLFDLINSEDEPGKPSQIMLQSRMKIRKSCGNKERIREIW